MQNFIFFDIDGTIISEDGYLPESNADRMAQQVEQLGALLRGMPADPL